MPRRILSFPDETRISRVGVGLAYKSVFVHGNCSLVSFSFWGSKQKKKTSLSVNSVYVYLSLKDSVMPIWLYSIKNIKKCQIFLLRKKNRPFGCVTLPQSEETIVIRNCHRHKNDRSAYAWARKMKFSPFGWTVPSWKINFISRCFFWMLVPLDRATPRTLTFRNTVARLELKCWATGDPGVLLRMFDQTTPGVISPRFDIFWYFYGISPHQLPKYKCHASLTVFPFTQDSVMPSFTVIHKTFQPSMLRME